MDTVRILNQVLAIHGGSLPMYLESAPPHVQSGDEKVWEAIKNVIDDQRLTMDKLADYVEELNGTPYRGEFPMDFTGMHDLSTDHMLRNVIERQECEIEWIKHLSGMLDAGETTARALVQEALGAAKGHLESLIECAIRQGVVIPFSYSFPIRRVRGGRAGRGLAHLAGVELAHWYSLSKYACDVR